MLRSSTDVSGFEMVSQRSDWKIHEERMYAWEIQCRASLLGAFKGQFAGINLL